MKYPVSQVARMAGFSVLSAGINIGVTVILHEVVGLSEEFSFAVAIGTTMTINFLACRYLIFDAGDEPIIPQALKFLISALPGN